MDAFAGGGRVSGFLGSVGDSGAGEATGGDWRELAALPLVGCTFAPGVDGGGGGLPAAAALVPLTKPGVWNVWFGLADGRRRGSRVPVSAPLDEPGTTSTVLRRSGCW